MNSETMDALSKLSFARPDDTYANGAKAYDGSPIEPHDVYYQFVGGDIKLEAEGASMDQLVYRHSHGGSSHHMLVRFIWNWISRFC